jgi:hypothetical protein
MSIRWLSGLLATTVVALGTLPAAAGEDASGRREFALKYRLAGSRITEECGYGGQFLQPTRNRPALKEEPKYRTKEPLYATFHLGAKKEAYALALDRSGGDQGGYDILYVDLDHDGRLTEAKKICGINGQQGLTFGPVKIAVDCGKENCPQWFVFQLSEYEFNPGQVYRSLQMMNAGYYQGVVRFGDHKCLVAFVDADGDGLYNGYLKADGGGDRLLMDLNGDGKLDGSYESEEAQPLGHHILAGGRYWHIDVAADGSSVTVEPLNKPLGTVRSDIRDYSVLLRGDAGILRVRTKDGTAPVPAGKYRLHDATYRITKQGKEWHFNARAEGKATEIDVPPDGVVKVPFGAPFVPKIQVSANGNDLALNLQLTGSGGEVYQNVYLGNNYERPPVPRARIVDAQGKELALLDFHYG